MALNGATLQQQLTVHNTGVWTYVGPFRPNGRLYTLCTSYKTFGPIGPSGKC